MIKVGDKVKLNYISDCNPHNNEVGIVIEESKYNYYPNGKPDEFILQQRCTIQYPDNSIEYVQDTERMGSGVVSPLIKVDN